MPSMGGPVAMPKTAAPRAAMQDPSMASAGPSAAELNQRRAQVTGGAGGGDGSTNMAGIIGLGTLLLVIAALGGMPFGSPFTGAESSASMGTPADPAGIAGHASAGIDPSGGGAGGSGSTGGGAGGGGGANTEILQAYTMPTTPVVKLGSLGLGS